MTFGNRLFRSLGGVQNLSHSNQPSEIIFLTGTAAASRATPGGLVSVPPREQSLKKVNICTYSYISYIGFPKEDFRFLKIKNIPDLLSIEKKVKI